MNDPHVREKFHLRVVQITTGAMSSSVPECLARWVSPPVIPADYLATLRCLGLSETAALLADNSARL